MQNNLEIQNLSKYACSYKKAQRLKEDESDIRPDFFRDIDRIIHSLSYTRYIDKTQVFTHANNDNITRRIVHVQFVSKIARTIGRALNLNEDLIEAAALGHDLGHVPYGHVGEKFLNELAYKYNQTYFNHNVQSVRTLMTLENNGKGCNLTYQVLDAILCHNGEFVCGIYKPQPKTLEDFIKEYKNCYQNQARLKKLVPSTLEGCVVRVSDIIAYLGRDIEDAMRLNIIKKEQLPPEIIKIIGDNNKNIINTIVLDIIKNSTGKPYIALSENIYQAIISLKKFNYENIYAKANDQEKLKEIKNKFNTLFKNYLHALHTKDTTSSIYTIFLNQMSEEYLKNNNDVLKVIDYIAGMTDEFFLQEYAKITRSHEEIN